MHLLLMPDWDTDGETLDACNLPQHVIVLNAPPNADKDQEYINNALSEALSDTFGFTHHGFDVEPIAFTNNRYNLRGVPRLHEKYMVAMMESPRKDERQQIVAEACLSYCHTNLFDINDAFANFTDEDEDNESSQIKVRGKVTDNITEGDIESLAASLGLPPIAD